MINLPSFKANIGGRGISTGNRYRVEIHGVQNIIPGGFTQEEMALCTNVNIAAPTFNMFNYKNLSPTLRIPHDVLFETLGLEFMNFDDGQPYSKFAKWQRAMYGDGMRMQDFNFYAQGKNVLVYEMNRRNQNVELFTYYNCYPMMLTKSLSGENRSTAEKFSVTFTYEESSIKSF